MSTYIQYIDVARHLHGLLYQGDQHVCLQYMKTNSSNSNIYLNVQFHGYTSIAIAAAKNLYDVVDDMIYRGADPNFVCMYGSTALMSACKYNSTTTAIRLINKHKCDKHMRDYKQQTALSIAIQYGSFDIARHLVVKHHIWELNIPDVNGDTPFMIACRRASYEFIAFMIYKGVDINIKNKANNSALSYAIDYQPEVCTLLLNHGADFIHVFETIHNSKFKGSDKIRLCLKNKYRDAIIHIINNNKTGFKKQFNKLLLFVKYKKHHPLYVSFKKTYAVDIIDIICNYII
ncbi:MAG: fibronectin type 3 and ankyrin repeat domains protein 1-like [Faunusvirus sp.]|jgi:ankyrin repeat protein|uniref:Fibronectin type 3 and ankyrin repeat domains protein 1-like n=1 Tax=Faunusvirus sp. TaxID=2487766 RepID=A0A3G4ZZJ5_9VIRU|nr:MAG: fibronectin type 3 and ankyrin repeat domains protein 1-like [Faunusvirus sp.]